jgi:tRNA(fMet)-specific endonuclease VapC
MTREAAPVTFEEFSSKLEEYFERVVHDHEEVIIESEEGALAVLGPAPNGRRRTRKHRVSGADHQAFLASASSWGDLVAAYLKGKTDATTLLNRLSSDGLAISVITNGEICEGIYLGLDPKRRERGFLEVLREVRMLPLQRQIMKHFARLRGDLRRRGQLISDMDLLIVATATTHNLTLVTGNKKHFQRVPGLSLY